MILSGEINSFQIIMTNDSTLVMDEEFVESPIEYEQKIFCMLELSAVFQEKSVKSDKLFVIIGKSSKFDGEMNGKYILHPVVFQFVYEDFAKIRISEVNVDFSLTQIAYFTEMYQQYAQIHSPQPNSLKYQQLQIELEIQQVLLSISHDFSISRNSTNTYFILQFDFPSFISKEILQFNTNLAIFYYNQQYFDWEPFIEKAELSVTYSQIGKLKKFEINSSDQINFNISSALISTTANF